MGVNGVKNLHGSLHLFFSKLIVRSIIVRGESRAMGAEAFPFHFYTLLDQYVEDYLAYL